jgi:hypothetical protein
LRMATCCPHRQTPTSSSTRPMSLAIPGKETGAKQGPTGLMRTEFMPMENLLEEISRHHFPGPPASPVQIEAFEQQQGWRLDPDLRAFYLHCNGATLFQRPNSPCRFRALSQIRRARVDMRNSDTDEWGPASWYIIADLPDSDRIIIDVSTPINGRYPIIDGFHEAMLGPEECKRITSSFSQFLEQMLHHQGHTFWLAPPVD